jgi:hypothetical protein
MLHLLLLPLFAAQLSPAATPAAAPVTLAAKVACPAKTAAGGAFTPADQRVNLSCACTPGIVECNPPVCDSRTFLYQKTDGECVYLCSFHQDCTQIACDCSESPVTTHGQARDRLGPYAPGACPPADQACGSICS